MNEVVKAFATGTRPLAGLSCIILDQDICDALEVTVPSRG